MSDVFNSRERSAVMRQVKSKGNKSTEQKLIDRFQQAGIQGWRRGYKVIGRPDFVFLNKKIAVFTDGCFWHGHNCRNLTPKQNEPYWASKREKNRQRDEYINTRFRQRGWRIVRFWECDIKRGDIDLTQF